MTLREVFFLKAAEKEALYKKCRHENLAVACRQCELEAEKALLEAGE